GRTFRDKDIVIIGDTPYDVTCGQALGVRAVAVATGRYDAAELQAAGADVVLPDLSETEAVLDMLLGEEWQVPQRGGAETREQSERTRRPCRATGASATAAG